MEVIKKEIKNNIIRWYLFSINFIVVVVLLFIWAGVLSAAGVTPQMDLIESYFSTGGNPQYKDNEQDLIYKTEQMDEIVFSITTSAQSDLNYLWKVMKGSEVLASSIQGTIFTWTVPSEKSTWEIEMEVTLKNKIGNSIGRDYLNWSITTADILTVNSGESIQNAVDNLPVEGGIVELLPGIYNPIASIQIINRTNITVKGSSAMREDIKIKYGMLRPQFHTFDIINSENITIENMYIYSTDTTSYLNKNDGNAIAITPFANNITISNLKVEWLGGIVHTYNVSGWDWPEDNQWSKNITIKNSLVLHTYDGITFWNTQDSTISNNEIGFTSGWPGINFNTKNINNLLENNTVYNSFSAGIYLYSSNFGNNVINNIVYSNTRGIILYTGGSNTQISKNIIRNNTNDGIYIYGNTYSANNIDILNNLIYDNGAEGIRVAGIARPDNYIVSIESNILYSNDSDAIKIDMDYYNIDARNNIIFNNSGYGLNRCQSSLISSYNNIFNNSLGNYKSTSVGVGDISLDPLFGNIFTKDFHLKSKVGRWDGSGWVNDVITSPCIDTGDLSDSCSNEPEPNGGRINMGAYGNTAEASMSIFPSVSPDIPFLPDGNEKNILIYPNPYVKGKSIESKINFTNLPKEATIRIYSLSGELIKRIKHKDVADGGSKEWDISGVSSGVYIYTIISKSYKETGKISLIK